MESIARFSMKHPVTVLILTVATFVMGIMGYSSAPRESMPPMEFPGAMLVVNYPGASAEVIDKEIASPMETALRSLKGVTQVQVQSSDGFARGYAMFAFDTPATDVNTRMQDAQQQMEYLLPKEAGRPMVYRFSSNSMPILTLAAVPSPDTDMNRFKTWLEDVVVYRLKQVPDVGQVDLGDQPQVRVDVVMNLSVMHAYGITPAQLAQNLSALPSDSAAGQLEDGEKITGMTLRLKTGDVDALRRRVVSVVGGVPVRLGDLATVKETVKTPQYYRIDGQPATNIEVTKNQGGNDMAVAKAVRALIPQLQAQAPEGVKLQLVYDNALFTDRAFSGMTLGYLYSGLCTALVMFLFLGSLRTTLVTLVAIPSSLLGAVWLLGKFGYTLNYMTLMGTTLAMGMVVDATIVVLENIQLKVNEGVNLIDASAIGTGEVGPSVVAGSLTTVAVFLPLAVMGGFFAQVLSGFALVIVLTIVLSTVVSFTLTPLLCVHLLRPSWNSRFVRIIQAPERVLTGGYRWLLGKALRHKLITLLIAVAVTAAGCYVFTFVPKEASVYNDEGIVSARLRMDDGTDKAVVSGVLDRMRDQVKDLSYVEHITTRASVGSGSMTVILKDSALYKRPSTSECQNQIEYLLSGIKDGKLMISRSYGDQSTVRLDIQGRDYDTVKAFARKLADAFNARGTGLRNGKVQGEDGAQTQKVLHINSDELSRLGISSSEVAQNLYSLFGQRQPAELKTSTGTQAITLELPADQKSTLDTLQQVALQSPYGVSVPLSSLVTVTDEPAPRGISRSNGMISFTVGADPDGDMSYDQARARVETIFKALAPADGSVVMDLGSQDTSYVEMMKFLLYAMVSAVGLVFVVMAVQFESIIKPLLIMFSLPLAMLGAFGALWLTGMKLNPFTAIGLVMLVGIAVNNAIILVDFADQRRAEGLNSAEAMQIVGPRRLRPILMTSLSTMAGALPIALHMSYGDEVRQDMAVALIGGMLTSTLLTLFVIPVLYTLVGNAKDSIAKRRRLRALRRSQRKAYTR